jgi:ubiquinone/menaquinone biosynthesis C-methylase UbiE
VKYMGQDLINIEKMYNSVAGEWAAAFAGEHDKKPMDQEVLRRFARMIGHRQPVWDFGCGPGNTTKFLHNLGVEISGLDLSEKMIEQAQRHHPTLRFQKGDMLALNFSPNSIAGIAAFYAIVHFTEAQVERAFQEVLRVLQPGGLFLFTYHIGEHTIHLDEFLGKRVDIDFMFFTTDFIRRCLNTVGFEKVEVTERDPYPNIEYQSRRAYAVASKPAA